MAIKHSPAKKKSAGGVNPLIEASVQYTLNALQTNEGANFLPLAQEKPTSNPKSVKGISQEELIQSELQAARLLNVDMPDEPSQFIRLLENRIREITGTAKNAILILDEDSGTYRCLNDEMDADFASPRELTWISDTYLQDLLESDRVIHSFLHYQGNVFGIVAIADKLNQEAFTPRDEVILEQLTQYLSVQVNHFLMLKRSLALPTIQKILLQLSNRLLCAVDTADIFQGALACLTQELPFQAGQYIRLNRKTGKGQILHEWNQNHCDVQTKRRDISHFVSILSLFQSQVWNHSYLYLKGERLGDKKFSELFGLPGIVSVVVLPIATDAENVDGALVLFQQDELIPLSKEALESLEQVPALVTAACSRAGVLEHALEIATTDELTGSLNRRGFYDRFDGEMDRARRNQSPMCMALIDIDYFKMVNDTYGHTIGDQVLKGLAQAMQKNIRKSDILCRYGGEEFALLLPETTLHDAQELLERLRKKIARTAFETAGGPLKITFSAGLQTVHTAKDISKPAMAVLQDTIDSVDEALYQAKQHGRNCLVVLD